MPLEDHNKQHAQCGAPEWIWELERARDAMRVEVAAVRVLAEKCIEEVRVMNVILKRLEKSLYGNGQPGQLQDHERRIRRTEVKLWLALGAIALMSFLSGNGIVSLKGLIGQH